MDAPIRTRVLREVAVVVVLVVVGSILTAVFDATAVDIAGIVLVGTGLVGGVAALFYEVGASEDRDRAATERERRRP